MQLAAKEPIMAEMPVIKLRDQDMPAPLFKFELDRITQPILRSWRWIVGIIAACLLVAVLAFLLTKPRYLGEATVRIDANAQRVVMTQDEVGDESTRDAERFLATTLVMARSASVREAVLRELRLTSNDDFFEAMDIKVAPGATAEDRRKITLDALSDGMSAELVGGTRIAAIGFSSPDAELSARLANSFARNLIRLDLQQRSGQSDFARSFLEGELGKLRTDLRGSENEANDYARGAAIVTLNRGATAEGPSATLTSEALARVNEQLSAATAKRIAAESDWNAIAGRDPTSIPEVISNSAVQQVVSQLTSVQAELDGARARHGDLHPEVRALEAKRDDLQTSLARLSGNIKRGLRTSYDSARSEEQKLRARLGELRGEQLTEQDRSVNLSILERETATKREQYDSLLDRYNEITAQAGAQVSNLSLLDPATPPTRPYWPILSLLLAIALAFGIVLAAAFVLARELFFGRLREPEDISRRVGLPLIGAIPAEDEHFESSIEERHSPLQEGYAEALASLLLASESGLPGSFVITSSASGDGKSTSVFMLAQAIGATGRKVLVIDGDMRRPTQHALFGLENAEGLSTLLTSEREVDTVARASKYQNVSVVTSGPIPPQPAELLSRSRFRVILDQAKANYDTVIIDSPPVIGFADPLLLGGGARDVVLIGRADKTRPAALRAAADKLSGAGTHVVGAILVAYRRSRRSGYNYYAYYGASDYKHTS